MKKTALRLSHGLVIATGILLLCSCSSPKQRIKEKQDVYDTYPEAIQNTIKQGNIDLGFTEDMVYIARGRPDRSYTRRTANGTVQVWSYTENYTTPNRQRVEGAFRVKDGSGHYRTVNDSVWVNVDQQHEYERKRIEFEDGIVTAIEEVNAERGMINSGY